VGAQVLIFLIAHAEATPSAQQRGMELPAAPVLAPWSRYGMHSLTTRPYLAAHRARYAFVPRLFPASLAAYRVAAPIADFRSVYTHPHHRFSPLGVSGNFVGGNVATDNDNLSSAVSPVDALGVPTTCLPQNAVSDIAGSSCTSPYVVVPAAAPVHMPVPELPSLQSPTQGPRRDSTLPPLPSKRRKSTPISTPRRPRPKFESSPRALHDAYLRPISLPETRTPAPRIANTACTVAIGDELSVIFPQAGLLSTVAMYGTVGSSLRLKRLSVPLQSRSGMRANDDSSVIAVASVDADGVCSEPARVAVSRRDTVHLAAIETGRRMTWTGEFAVNNLYSVAFSSVCSDNVLTLCADGLRVHTMDSTFGVVSTFAECDVWPLRAGEYRYFKSYYGAHPRTTLLASQVGLHRVDLRAARLGSSNGGVELDASAELLVDVWRDWGMSSGDSGVRVCEPHPRVPFWSVMATDHSLAVVDERMPRTPLLAWSLTSSPATPLTLACVGSMPSGSSNGDCYGQFGDVIGLGTPKDGTLSVHHMLDVSSGVGGALGVLESAVQQTSGSNSTIGEDAEEDTDDDHDGKKPDIRDRDKKSKGLARTPCIPPPSLVWSDHPLLHLDSFAPTECLTGLAVIPHTSSCSIPYHDRSRTPQSGACMSIVQVSANGSSIAQLIGCNTFKDGDHAFETLGAGLKTPCEPARANCDNKDGDLEEFLRGVDTHIALREAQAVHMTEKSRDRLLFDRQNDGIRVLGNTGRLHAMDVLNVQRRICDPKDDDKCKEGDVDGSYIPRPHLRDRPLIDKLLTEDQQPSSTRGQSREARKLAGVLDPDSVEAYLSTPRTLREIAQLTRSGNPHAKTPLDIKALRDMLDDSPYIESYEVGYPELDGNVPDAVVYTTGADADTADNQLTAPFEATPFAELLDDLRKSYYCAEDTIVPDTQTQTQLE
jgi:hypothetical protein